MKEMRKEGDEEEGDGVVRKNQRGPQSSKEGCAGCRIHKKAGSFKIQLKRSYVLKKSRRVGVYISKDVDSRRWFWM